MSSTVETSSSPDGEAMSGEKRKKQRQRRVRILRTSAENGVRRKWRGSDEATRKTWTTHCRSLCEVHGTLRSSIEEDQ